MPSFVLIISRKHFKNVFITFNMKIYVMSHLNCRNTSSSKSLSCFHISCRRFTGRRFTEEEISSCAQGWKFFTLEASYFLYPALSCAEEKSLRNAHSRWLSSSSRSVPVVQDSSLPESPHDLRDDGEDSLTSGRP